MVMQVWLNCIGDVSCENVSGNVESMSGNVNCKMFMVELKHYLGTYIKNEFIKPRTIYVGEYRRGIGLLHFQVICRNHFHFIRYLFFLMR